MKTTFKEHIWGQSCLTFGTVTSSHPLMRENLQSWTIKPRLCDLLLLQMSLLPSSSIFGDDPMESAPCGQPDIPGKLCHLPRAAECVGCPALPRLKQIPPAGSLPPGFLTESLPRGPFSKLFCVRALLPPFLLAGKGGTLRSCVGQ